MPQIIPVAATLIAMGAGVEGTNLALIYLGSTVLSYLLTPKAKVEKSQQQSRLVNTRSSSEILKLVYGQVRVGGNDVFIEAVNPYFWVVQTLAEGECDSIATDDRGDIIWFGENRIQDYEGYESHYFVGGSSAEVVQPELNAAVPAWTDTLRNTCYIVWALTYNSKLYYGLPTRNVVLKGKKLYDFRTESTAWSANPVLALYDYMTNDVCGLNKPESKFDLVSWQEAANYCDDKGFVANLAFTSKDTAKSIMDEIKKYFRGQFINDQGKIGLLYSDTLEESAVGYITDDEIIQDDSGKAIISISQPSPFDKVDGLICKYTDPDLNYKENELIIGESSGILEDLDLIGLYNKNLVSELGTYYFERRQLDRTIQVLCRDVAAKYLPHDLIYLTTTAMSISSQLMRIVSSQRQVDGNFMLAMIYEDDKLYNKIMDLLPSEIYTCTLPDPTAYPSQVINITFSSTENFVLKDKTYKRIKISWTIPTYYPYIDRVEVWARRSESDDFIHYATGTDQCYFGPVEFGESWQFVLLPINIWGYRLPIANASIWGHDISLKDESLRPENITNFQIVVIGDILHMKWDDLVGKITGNNLSNKDILGYEIRLGSTWNQALPLFLIQATSKTLAGVKPGTHTFMIAAKDAYERYSETPASKTITILGPPGYEEVYTEIFDFTGGTFDGTERYDLGSGVYCLQVDRGEDENLTGTWTSDAFDMESIQPMRFWLDYILSFYDPGTSKWQDVFVGSDKWNEIAKPFQSWSSLFGGGYVGDVNISLEWCNDGSSWDNSCELFEILSMEVNTRYVRFKITLVDNDSTRYIRVLESGLQLNGWYWYIYGGS